MQPYIAKRLLLLVPSILGAATLIFVLIRAVPGDYVDAVLADASSGGASLQEVERLANELRQELGLNDPLPFQYARWLGTVARGDLGYSLSQRRSAWDAVRDRLGPTMEITLMALILACLWSLPVGAIAAVNRKGPLDVFARLLGIVFLSIPAFWLGVLLLFLMITFLGTGPPLVYSPLWVDPVGNLKMVAWPSVVLALHVGAPLSRLTRSQLLEVLAEDYMRTAMGKGLTSRQAVVRHALRNAAIPILTLLGTQLGRLFGGAVVVEAVFNVPGMGTGLITAVARRDYDLIGAFLLVTVLLLLLLNLAIDMLYTAIDPRVRSG